MGLILTQAVTKCRLATKAGEAMFFDEDVDFSAYAGGTKLLAFKDSGGKFAYAYGSTVGGGETLGADLSPSNNAISDSQTEANATTGWSATGTPDTFESTAAGTPNTGSYHFHVVGVGAGYKGFFRSAGTVDMSGRLYKQAYAIKVISGTARVDAAGTGVNITKLYGVAGYINSALYYTGGGFALAFYFRTHNVAGEFYIDNENSKALTNVPATGLLLVSAYSGATRSMLSTEAGFLVNSIVQVLVYNVVAPSTPSPADGATVAYTTSQALQVTNADSGACDIKFYTGAGVQIGATQVGVAAGATATVTWSGLVPGLQSWYATSTNTVGTVSSPVWSFTSNTIPVIVGNVKPTSASTRKINTSMRLMIDVSDDDGNALAVEFYNTTSGSPVLIGSDSSITGSGTAQYLWTDMELDTLYKWKARVWDGLDEAWSEEYTFTTSAFTLFSYIENSARQFPLDYALSILGADYHTIAAWNTDKLTDKDLVALEMGEALGIPSDLSHEETVLTAAGIIIEAGNDSADYSPVIFAQNPTTKSQVHITNDSAPIVATIGLQLKGNACCYDIQQSFSSTFAFSAAAGIAILFAVTAGGNGRLVGCLSGDITTPNMAADTVPIGFTPFGTTGEITAIECAIDLSRTWSIGLAPGIIGFYQFAVGSTLANCTATGCVYGFAAYGVEMTRINCCAQNNLVADTVNLGLGGSFANTTCADSQELTIAADGFTMIDYDGGGTNLSAIFTDDINGIAWVTSQWSRSVNYIVNPEASNTKPLVTDIYPTNDLIIPYTTSINLSAKYFDADEDVGSLEFRNASGVLIGTVTGITSDNHGIITYTGLSAGSWSFIVTPHDGTEYGTSSSLITFTISANQRTTWLVKGCRYYLRNVAPLITDSPPTTPFIWIDTESDLSYEYSAGTWIVRVPDETITTTRAIIKKITI